MTELYNVTSFLDASNTTGIGVPPILIMVIILMAVYLHTRNIMYMVLVGIVMFVTSYMLGITTDIIKPLIALGVLLVIHIISKEDVALRLISRHSRRDMITHDATFIKKIMVVFGLAHKKEIKSNDKP